MRIKMKSGRTDNTNIKSSLCEALCILAENKPREKITITSLIEKAGISRSSFYYYFENVDAVFYYMIDEFCREYQKAGISLLNEKIRGNIQELLEAEQSLCDIVLKHSKEITFFLKDMNYCIFKERFIQNFQEHCQTMWVTAFYSNGERSEIVSRTAYEYSIYICAGQMLSVLELWEKRGFRESPEDFVSLYEQTFTASLEFYPRT